MNFRLRLAAWFAFCSVILATTLILTAHYHLDEELRKDRWDRSHPQYPEWSIHSSYTDEEVGDILGELIKVWLWVGIPLVLGSVAAGYLIALRSARPIRQINRELDALDSQSLKRGVQIPEKDEGLATLVRRINELLFRINISYTEMADYSARVAHELRTPLTLLRMRMEAAAPDLPSDFSEEMQEDIRRLSSLVERSLLTAKVEGGKIDIRAEAVDLSALLDDLHEGYHLLAEEKPIALDWDVAPGLKCCSDPDLILQILHNLIGNALRHGSDRIHLRLSTSRDGSRILLSIVNFARYEASETHGTGIGLRLVKSLADTLPGLVFHERKTTTVFAVRLSLENGSEEQGNR